MIKFKQVALGSAFWAMSQACVSASYHENFNGYVTGVEFAKSDFHRELGERLPIAWFSSVYVQAVSLDEPINGIDEGAIKSPINPLVSEAGKGASGVPSVCETNCAIRFWYSGYDSLNEDGWSELRFRLNNEMLGEKKGLEDIWVQYDQYIPMSYHYRSVSPNARNPFQGGHKEFVLYADEYSDANPTLVFGSLLSTENVGQPGLEDISYLDYTFSTGGGDVSASRDYCCESINGEDVLIDPSVDKGFWQRRTIHVKMPTSETSNDGVVEFWVKHRVGEPDAFVKKLYSYSKGDFYGYDQNYLNKGYILGWTNNGYNHDVVYLVDNFIIADSINGIDQDAILEKDRTFPPSPPTLNAPK